MNSGFLLKLRMNRLGVVLGRFWPPYLWRELEQQRRIIENECRDWAEDHTHLQKLCREVGCTELEVEGDEHGVPGIQDLADSLRKRIPDR